MKLLTVSSRLLSLGILSLFLLTSLPAITLAGVNPAGPCRVEDCSRQVTIFMQNAYDNLTKSDTGITTEYINDYLQAGREAAKKWQPDAFLLRFNLLYDPGSTDSPGFSWASPSDKNHLFHTGLGGYEQEETLEKETRHNGIFRIPMRLRDLMKAMLEGPKLLPLLDKLYQGKTIEESLYSANFLLEKNAQNRLTWTVTFFSDILEPTTANSDIFQGKVYKVIVSAEKKDNPVFTILRKI